MNSYPFKLTWGAASNIVNSLFKCSSNSKMAATFPHLQGNYIKNSKVKRSYCNFTQQQIINNYWPRLSKIFWFVSSEQINYLPKPNYLLWQIIDLRDIDKSQYFAITKFNNCFIIQSPSLFSYFNHFPVAQGSDLPFFLENMVPITHEQNIICSKTCLDGTMH